MNSKFNLNKGTQKESTGNIIPVINQSYTICKKKALYGILQHFHFDEMSRHDESLFHSYLLSELFLIQTPATLREQKSCWKDQKNPDKKMYGLN